VDWCNPESVRDNLMFSDFIVTLTGIANISAATVHAYKRYKAGVRISCSFIFGHVIEKITL